LILLSAATWLAAAFLQMIHRDLGFDPHHLMTLSVSLTSEYDDVDRRTRFIEALVGKVRALPGVRLAAAAMPTPLAGHQMGISFEIEGRPSRPGARPTSDMAIITPGYFATIATPLVAGRDFDDTDDHRHPRVMIVNQAFADKFFPGLSPIGRRIRSGATGPHDDDGSPMREIVGIVGNARQAPVALGPEPIYYLPFRQMPWGAAVLVRSELAPEALMPALQRLTSDMDGQAAVHGLTTFEAMLARGVAGPQLVVLLMGSFAIIALVLTATGLYGLLAYGVQQRTREIGVRMALGAMRPTIVAMVTREALAFVAGGLFVGGLGVLAVTGALRAQLAVVGPPPALMLAIASALVVVTALVSATVPARRAASVDPTEALRSE
ncbi:MAG TPA: FtsX-like permease family protein, partial [Vicinamibacterales bacterium]|nr:FtsX-like permease family protein [Vicinamibacterales bacterium]